MASINADTLPRISTSLTLASLKVECKARGLKTNVTKEEALRVLTPGSVHLSGTEEFRRLETIKTMHELSSPIRD